MEEEEDKEEFAFAITFSAPPPTFGADCGSILLFLKDRGRDRLVRLLRFLLLKVALAVLEALAVAVVAVLLLERLPPPRPLLFLLPPPPPPSLLPLLPTLPLPLQLVPPLLCRLLLERRLLLLSWLLLLLLLLLLLPVLPPATPPPTSPATTPRP
jgi:hypothetical protein